MKKILLSFFLFCSYSCIAQWDTTVLLRLAKINLITKLDIRFTHTSGLDSYLDLPLKATLVNSKGFDYWLVYKLSQQTLASDSVRDSIRHLIQLPFSAIIDSPYSNTYVIAINFKGDIYCIGGCDDSDMGQILAYNEEYHRRRHRRFDVDWLNNYYKLEGFKFQLINKKMMLRVN